MHAIKKQIFDKIIWGNNLKIIPYEDIRCWELYGLLLNVLVEDTYATLGLEYVYVEIVYSAETRYCYQVNRMEFFDFFNGDKSEFNWTQEGF
jgi:hypothetical protein